MGWEVLVGDRGLTYNPRRNMPILDERTLEFLSHSPEQSQRLGVRLGEITQSGALYCLSGDLGSGKTTLAKGIARGWGALDRVTSPSFVFINEYRRADSARLYHFDAYRLDGAVDAAFIGLTDLLDSQAPILIEWPERVGALLPEKLLWIRLHWVDESRRNLQFEARGPRYERLLRQFRKSAFGG